MGGWQAIAGLALGLVACAEPQPGLFPERAALLAEAHARFDPDGDGRITAEEYRVFDPEPGVFREMDTTADGAVTTDELEAFLLAKQPRALVSRRGLGPKTQMGGETPAGAFGPPPGTPPTPGAWPPPGTPPRPGAQPFPPGPQPPRGPPNVPLQHHAPAAPSTAPSGAQ